MGRLIKYLIIFVMFLPFSSFAKKAGINANVSSFSQEKYFGDENTEPSVHSVYVKEITKIENYLNNFETFTASFKQSNRAGAIRYGQIFISKPGNIRCEYLPPSPITLVMKDKKIVFYDKDLDQVSYTSSDMKSIRLLAVQNFKFSDVDLVEVEKDNHFIEFTVKEYIENSKQILLLTLRFTYPQVELKQITITTEESDIDLILDNYSYNQILGKELFSFNSEIIRKGR
jgi:outer membrane lipoprotein-sorting protein